ncbi:hypothetical protein DIPPA_61827 [Diplonema papillatum]|nr:hypothetical protein DIPPA_61827 [Diplonema papillatum]
MTNNVRDRWKLLVTRMIQNPWMGWSPPPSTRLKGVSDASGVGWGFVVKGKGIYGSFPRCLLEAPIFLKELFAVWKLVDISLQKAAGVCLEVDCDNTVVIGLQRRGFSLDATVQGWLTLVENRLAERRSCLRLAYVPTDMNEADCITRLPEQRWFWWRAVHGVPGHR